MADCSVVYCVIPTHDTNWTLLYKHYTLLYTLLYKPYTDITDTQRLQIYICYTHYTDITDTQALQILTDSNKHYTFLGIADRWRWGHTPLPRKWILPNWLAMSPYSGIKTLKPRLNQWWICWNHFRSSFWNISHFMGLKFNFRW